MTQQLQNVDICYATKHTALPFSHVGLYESGAQCENRNRSFVWLVRLNGLINYLK